MKVYQPVMLFSALAIAGSLSTAWAESGAGGTISFRGAIVEDMCEVGTNNKSDGVSVACPVQGKMVQQNVALADIDRTTVDSNGQIKMSVRYLNPEKSVALISMSYN